jgi:hypothetical protein
MRINQGVSPGNTDTITLSQPFKDLQVGPDFLKTFMFRGIFPVTPRAGKIALGGRLQPGNNVVRIAPRESVIVVMI